LPTTSDDGICREPGSGPSYSEDEEFLQLKAMSFAEQETVRPGLRFPLAGTLRSQHRQNESDELWAVGSEHECCRLA